MAKQNKKETQKMGPEITQDPDRLDDAVELTTVKNGEHKIRYLAARSGVDKNGADYFQARFEVANDPYVKDFTYFLGLPSQYDDAKQMNQKKTKLKDFCLALGVDPPASIADFKALMNSGDLVGLEAWAVLVEKDTDDYGMQNEIKKFLKPV
jgi:hypothetical protein